MEVLQKLIRPPDSPSDLPPVLVLMHGLGADEHDLMGLASELDERLCVVSLRAPGRCEFGGYAWFDVTWDENGVHADEEGALAARELVLTELESLPEALGFQPAKLFLGGFSQGAMMTLGVALNSPQILSGAILLSGRLLPKFVPNEVSPDLIRLPFLIQHGVADQVVPVAEAREAKRFLEGMGVPLAYQEYPMGHEISFESLENIRIWLSNQIE